MSIVSYCDEEIQYLRLNNIYIYIYIYIVVAQNY